MASTSTSTATPPGTPKKLQKRLSKQYSSCLLYNTSQALVKLTDLSLAACNPTREENPLQTTQELDSQDQNVVVQQRADFTTVSDKMSCNFCNIDFVSRHDQTKHYKSDWHRYNLRLRLKGRDSVTEAQFEEMSACVSSISGSESETDDSDVDEGDKPKPHVKPGGLAAHLRSRRESCSSSNESESELTNSLDDAARRYPKVFFRNKDGELVSVYRCVLYHKKNQPASQNDLVTIATNLPHHMTWAVLMAAGGHFAGAVFNKNEILVHKTFHRYVVRAKRGTAQGSRDSQGNAPKSAGASLRRYNEAALKEDIQELITSWSEEIKKCDLIFLRAPSFNKRIFFSGKTPPLQKTDQRIRMIPFATRRPTHNEIRRVHEVLCSVECYGEESDIRNFIPVSPPVTFSTDTGHLELVPDDDPQTSPRHRKKDKGKLKTSPLVSSETKERPDSADSKPRPSLKHQQLELLDANQNWSSGTSTASDTDLVECMESISTADLREYAGTRKPRPQKHRARKRRPSLKRQIEPESDAFEEEKYHLKNSLYTACKVGDIDTLQNLLAVFSTMMTQSDREHTQPITDQSQPITDQDHPIREQNQLPQSGVNRTPVTSVNCNKSVLEDSVTISQVIPKDKERVTIDPERTTCVKVQETDSVEEFSVIHCSSTSTYLSNDDVSEASKKTSDKDNMNLDINNKTCKTLQGPGCLSKSEELLSPMVSVAILNEPIGDQQTTLLHVAAKEGHKKVIRALMEAGADPAVKDKFGQTPYVSTTDKETRNEFRRFMARFPDKYDYETAKVPSPLTAEMEAERRQKEADRKKVQKKAKQERVKEKKVEEAAKKKEEAEKNRFLALPDREKRALAAEKRLLKQKNDEGLQTPILSRCFQCATDITGKVPFEYNDYKFCTTKCLKEHRLKNSKS